MKTKYISLDAAEQFICEACERPGCPILWGNDCDRIDRLNTIPAADVRPAVRGKWKQSDFIPGMMTCTNCGAQRNPKFKIGGGTWNYCPNCGAQMTEAHHGSP